jgi:hypothetical protein
VPFANRAALFVPVALLAVDALIPFVLKALLATVFLNVVALFALVAVTEDRVAALAPVTVTL